MTSKKDELLDIAEKRFGMDGFKAVNLTTIAKEAAIKKSSIYHHFPEGKEQIYVEVHMRIFKIHGEKLNSIVKSSLYFDEKINAVIDWMLSQPGMHLIPMMHHDMENLSTENYDLLFRALFQNVFQPISKIFEEAKVKSIIEIRSPQSVTGGFLALLDSFDIIPNMSDPKYKERALRDVISIYIDGMRRDE